LPVSINPTESVNFHLAISLAILPPRLASCGELPRLAKAPESAAGIPLTLLLAPNRPSRHASFAKSIRSGARGRGGGVAALARYRLGGQGAKRWTRPAARMGAGMLENGGGERRRMATTGVARPRRGWAAAGAAAQLPLATGERQPVSPRA
jgi:hypothetical protein